jgi:hypothetical protein
VNLAGDVTNIVEVIFKTAKTLRELNGKWKDADLTIANLIAQLDSPKRVLNKLGKWIRLDLAGVAQHHQLVLDLVILHSITCCEVPVKLMDNDVSKMDWKVENKLDLGMKIKALMQGKHRARTSRSLSAGRRLMTAYNWHDIFFQTYLVLHFVRTNLQTAQRQ